MYGMVLILFRGKMLFQILDSNRSKFSFISPTNAVKIELSRKIIFMSQQ